MEPLRIHPSNQDDSPPPQPNGPAASSGSEIPFTPLEAEAPPQAASFAEIPAPPAPIEPFTGEEIVSGAAVVLALGLRFQTPEEAQVFTTAFRSGIVPMLPPAAVLDALQVGEALARYGIGRNAIPGIGNLAQLPDWLRLVLGGLVLAMAAYGGINAARAVREPVADTVDSSSSAPVGN